MHPSWALPLMNYYCYVLYVLKLRMETLDFFSKKIFTEPERAPKILNNNTMKERYAHKPHHLECGRQLHFSWIHCFFPFTNLSWNSWRHHHIKFIISSSFDYDFLNCHFFYIFTTLCWSSLKKQKWIVAHFPISVLWQHIHFSGMWEAKLMVKVPALLVQGLVYSQHAIGLPSPLM